MQTPVAERVRKRRLALRAAGLRPLQLWVPDVRRPNFFEECQRQSLVVAQADMHDAQLLEFLDEALADIEVWTD
jgi:hypothetical protein